MIEAKYIAHMGDDLMVVNAARVSFAKESSRLGEKDSKLIRYLASHGHWTPFAHPQVTIHVRAPVFVRTQCFKHKVGFAENEVSRRYVDETPEFYEPSEWRGRPVNKKQGSDGVITCIGHDQWREPISPGAVYLEALGYCARAYAALVSGGVAPEQARMVLPQAMMTEWYWTGSLAAWARFCRQRMGKDAQVETGIVADRCAQLISPLFPLSWAALMESA